MELNSEDNGNRKYILVQLDEPCQDNTEAKKKAISEFDWAEEAGYTLDNPDFAVLYMANVESTIYNEDGEIIAKEEF